MVKLDPLQAFVAVVRAGGFSAAARRSGTPRSTLSLQVRSLEQSLDLRLLKRSTRSITLTEDGQRLFQEADGLLDRLDRTMESLRGHSGTLQGLIRITAPSDFPGLFLAEAVAGFTRQHPEVRFAITLTNTKIDLVRENIDIAIRAGRNHAPDAVERPLLDMEWTFCASSEWVAHHGQPRAIADITQFIAPPVALRNYLKGVVLGGAELPEPAIEVDNHFMARDLVVCGFGVGLLPTGLCREALANEQMQQLLPDSIQGSTRLTLTFPSRADMVPRIRAFADYLCGTLQNRQLLQKIPR
ncbi:LysR family transcriptional regulator [Altericroceibacterium spongiae]|uniref:LysR family transcriptional regulator n=1 Tax=Altericroceibacterium spongiae TaxID=2320269 RepID=A0A420EEB4_9SPHN|nr:LysR family transcriptional regulator [Altericroceibacterium spongiae]RKF19008.1 LysR family transcriptional regulator [Altericroceibacterium spongiae]